MPNKSSNKGHIPLRSCVICRTKIAKSSLNRFVIENSEVIFDEKKMQRGYYICSSETCKKKLPKWLKKKFKIK